MAKRAASKSIGGQTTQVLGRLQTNIKTLQGDAERLLKRTQKQAQIITRDQRKAVDRVIKQARKLRTDLEKRAQKATKTAESRADKFLSTVEKETSRRLGPLLKRFDLPSRQEIQALTRRINQIEKHLRTAESTPTQTGTANPTPPRDGDETE